MIIFELFYFFLEFLNLVHRVAASWLNRQVIAFKRLHTFFHLPNFDLIHQINFKDILLALFLLIA